MRCVGSDLCTYKQMPRIDVIGSNGGDGSHYIVEKVAKAIAGPDAEWESLVPTAIKVIELVKGEIENEH